MTTELTHKNPSYFYNSEQFKQLHFLEENFAIIRKELIELISIKNEQEWLRTFPDYVKADRDKAWKVFSFLFFMMKNPVHRALCKKTTELIDQIPELISCDFSYMEPNTQILPHKGYSRMVLRCHLPLIVPNPADCGIRVGNETRHWEEGKLLIFDDSFEHEAWNKSNERRVVLMFDIPNPLWGYTAEEISKYKIMNLDDPFLLSLANKEDWISAFEKLELPKVIFS
jgi:beta-hydroxylase